MITEIIEAFVWYTVLQSWSSHFRSQFWFGLSSGSGGKGYSTRVLEAYGAWSAGASEGLSVQTQHFWQQSSQRSDRALSSTCPALTTPALLLSLRPPHVGSTCLEQHPLSTLPAPSFFLQKTFKFFRDTPTTISHWTTAQSRMKSINLKARPSRFKSCHCHLDEWLRHPWVYFCMCPKKVRTSTSQDYVSQFIQSTARHRVKCWLLSSFNA